MSLSLIAAFFVSVIIHATLIVFGPEIHYSDPPDIEKDTVEVEVVKREVPIPDALRPKPLPLVPKPAPLDMKRLPERSVALQIPPKPIFRADPSLQREKNTPKSRPLTGPPKLRLPKQVTPLDEIDQTKFKPIPNSGQKENFPLSLPASSDGLEVEEKPELEDKSLRFASQELSRLRETRSEAESRQSIRGPAGMRRIVFRPPPPKGRFSGASGDITLRFWVLSDGTVGRVIPVRKGNAQLEGIAVNHMKRWRFSPLPPGVPEREEWGLIVFRFRLK